MFEIDFHHHRPLVAASLITGAVQVSNISFESTRISKTNSLTHAHAHELTKVYSYSSEGNALVQNFTHHTASCRSVVFGLPETANAQMM